MKLIEQFSYGLFFWQTILFLLLLFVLHRFAWKPILKAINDREKSIEESLNQAKKAREEMVSLQAENEKVIQAAREERDAMLKEARVMRDKTINAAKEKAKEEADKIMAQTRSAIETQKQAAIAGIKHEVANLSIGIAEKVLRKELENKSEQEELVNSLIKEIKLS